MIDLERDLARYGDYLVDTVPAVEPEEVQVRRSRRLDPWRRPVLVLAAAAALVLLVVGGSLFVLRPSPERRPTVTVPTTPAPTVVPEPETTAITSTSLPQSPGEGETGPIPRLSTVIGVEGWIQDRLDQEFATSSPPRGMTGPVEVRCDDSGPAAEGDVFACEVWYPDTLPGFEFVARGLVVYVLDQTGDGRAAWIEGRDVPTSTDSLLTEYETHTSHGLVCRDLLSGDPNAGIFAGDPERPEESFFSSLVYWQLEGSPDRMDADGNGIPCETLYDPAVVSAVLAGGRASSATTGADHVFARLPIVLRGDGLGVVDFGTPTAEALTVLEGALGPPSRSETGFFRYYYWDEVALSVSFDEYPFYRDDGVEHLVGWSHWEGGVVPLYTGEGVDIHADYDSLVDAYGSLVSVPEDADECLPQWYVWLNDPAPDPELRILVILDAAPEQGGNVTGMRAGAGEGC